MVKLGLLQSAVAERSTLSMAMLTITLASCTPHPVNSVEEEDAFAVETDNEEEVLSKKEKTGSKLEKSSFHAEQYTKLCIYSDFHSEIRITIQNMSSDVIKLQHNLDEFSGRIELYSSEGSALHGEMWEPMPPPTKELPVAEPGQLLEVRFSESSIGWRPISEAQKICYSTIVEAANAESSLYPRRVCVNVLPD